ncbi:hypothetical protein HispidOSU_023038, partial [Sigmodon hispidus]
IGIECRELVTLEDLYLVQVQKNTISHWEEHEKVESRKKRGSYLIILRQPMISKNAERHNDEDVSLNKLTLPP